MKIAVCIKQVPDTDDVKIDRKTGTLKRSEVSGILNPEDMSAVRMAAALRREMEKKGEKSSLTAITMGPPAASELLERQWHAGRMRESCCVTGHLPEGIPLLPLWYWRRR